MEKFLSDIKVVEMGTYVVVPKAARMLADWGADVIKVELPGGETWRHYGRVLSLPADDGNNVLFQTENVNKRCIALNLKTPEGIEVLMKLLETADVFLTNTRTKSLEKMGLDYESLKERFPRLIYANFTGMGEEGPDKDKPGYDVSAFWSRSSILYEWCLKENTPFKPKPGFGDSTTAPALAAGVLAALYNRTKTGRGEKVKLSLMATGMFYNSVGMLIGQYLPREKYPESRYGLQNPSYAVYKTRDDDWVIFSITDWDNRYPPLLEALGLSEYIGHPLFSTLASVKANIQETTHIFEDAILRMGTDEILEALSSRDIVCEKLAQPWEVARDQQAWANGYLSEVTMRDGSKVVLPNNPVQFESMPQEPMAPAPLLGEHSVSVLRDLGYSDSQIEDYIEKKVIRQHP